MENESGLRSAAESVALDWDAVSRLERVKGIAVVRFTAADVVRHPLVGRIVEAYEGPGR